ncbi:MAG: hypothetical protein ACLSWL_01105 [Ruminococcus sp.]|nr:hypothetical protein [Ruminococcus bromii]
MQSVILIILNISYSNPAAAPNTSEQRNAVDCCAKVSSKITPT